VGLRVSLAVASVIALAWTGSATAAAKQELTIQASDGVSLACGLVEPSGSPPAGGWTGLLLFHGNGQTHAQMETIASLAFAPAGYASLACDPRGDGSSGGTFGLGGPRDVQDVRELFNWVAARPEVSDTQIAALGLSLGGGLVWQAAAAGVPFKAIVPAITWTSLASALAPQSVPRTGLIPLLAQDVPLARWDPSLAAIRDTLAGGSVTPAFTAAAAARSVRSSLGSLTVPTLMLQGRHDFLFDLDQALSAYRLLHGPKELYIGDLGHAPATNPPAEQLTYFGVVLNWLNRYVSGSGGAAPPAVVLGHDPWDGTVTTYRALPRTRTASVTLPGTTTLQPASQVSRSARLTGGPNETFGGGTVKIRYSGAQSWPRLVATISVAGSAMPVTVGAVRVTKPAGIASIHLLDECVLLPRGKRVVVTIGAASSTGLYAEDAPAGARITVGRVALTLSLLKRPVSR
jgi:alpha-beta hydrolase superfamily lysophospholipase